MGPGFLFRRKARVMVLQALYSELYTNYPVETIEAQFWESRNLSCIDVEYFIDIFRGVIHHKKKLDEYIIPYIDRELKLISSIELCILRMGAYELAERQDVPFQVILNEAVEMSKSFGGDKSYRYTNGILDRIAVDLRPDEVRAYRERRTK